jgi:hypothetical protein
MIVAHRDRGDRVVGPDDAGIVDEDIEPALLRLDPSQEVLSLGLSARVMPNGNDPIATVARVNIGRIDRCPFLCEEIRRRASDAARGARDDGDLALEPHAASPANSMTYFGLLRLGETIALNICGAALGFAILAISFVGSTRPEAKS